VVGRVCSHEMVTNLRSIDDAVKHVPVSYSGICEVRDVTMAHSIIGNNLSLFVSLLPLTFSVSFSQARSIVNGYFL
jgi:hypothetical protein